MWLALEQHLVAVDNFETPFDEIVGGKVVYGSCGVMVIVSLYGKAHLH